MKIYIKNHKLHYEIENLCRLFFPNEKFVKCYEDIRDKNENFVYTELVGDENEIVLKVLVSLDSIVREKRATVSYDVKDQKRECEIVFAKMLFDIFNELTALRPPWGILTGIRPIKLLRNMIREDGYYEAINQFQNSFLVTEDKMNLAIKTMKEEEKILNLSKANSFSLYVSIPFCPSRCSYCSFVSQSIEQAARLIPQYVKLLCEELEHTAVISKDLNLRLETVYIGGGTPTTLSSEHLRKLILTIKKNFDMSTVREFTVEAGRPDTITREKLLTLKELGIERISINPQTLNDAVLNRIGRKHSAKEAISAFEMAEEIGFGNINMDLIAGLPGENLESFINTINHICKLDPQSITIHTLCMKKASDLTEQGKKIFKDEEKIAVDMMKFAENKLNESGYLPYYLYRQSRMVGNLENVGWAKRGNQGLYNVYVMDETHTILSCGAGAVSKLKDPNSKYLERIFNFKFPYEYISGFKEMIDRKDRVKEFYDELR